jgi:hypothetical protein
MRCRRCWRLARSHPLVRVDLQIANTAEVGEAVLALEVDWA